MKTTLFFAAAAAAVLLAGVATGCRNHKGETDSEAVPEIMVAQVEVDSITLHKTYPGNLISNNTVDVVARVNGYLRQVHFNGGDNVTKGQLLFTIEDQTYRNAVSEAEAALATAQSTHDYAVKQYAAMSKAYESDAVSQMELLNAKNQMESSAAAIKQAQAQLQTARTNLGYCRVTAPMSGTITSRSVDPGGYVAGEASPVRLATVYDNSKVIAVFYIDDSSYERMFSTVGNREGLDFGKVPVKFSEPLPHSYTADLYYMSPSVDTSTGTLKLQAQIDNPWNELRDGMYVSVDLPWKTDPRAMLVKDASISTDQLGKYVYVVNDSDRVVYTPIVAGDLYNDTMRVVTDGLKPGDRYVTRAMLKVRRGMTVKPVMSR